MSSRRIPRFIFPTSGNEGHENSTRTNDNTGNRICYSAAGINVDSKSHHKARQGTHKILPGYKIGKLRHANRRIAPRRLRDYIESRSERGRASPASERYALKVWPEALGIDRPLTNPMVISSAKVESADEPKQAPSIDIETVEEIELTASNIEICAYKRAYAAGILLLAYAGSRLAGVQKLRPFKTNVDSAYGALITGGAKKQIGQRWSWARPRMGITSNTIWAQPLLDMRQAYAEINGREIHYVSPAFYRSRVLVAEGHPPYCDAMRKIALLCVWKGDADGE